MKLGNLRLSAVMLAVCAMPAHGTIIQFSVEKLSGAPADNAWQYHYSVQNDTPHDIELFSIVFDRNLHENLRGPQAPPGWDPLVFEPSLTLPDDGLFDVAAVLGPDFLPVTVIRPGEFLADFSVVFDFLGQGVPGAQPFVVWDPLTFGILESGNTVAAASVPEPAALSLLALGLAALSMARRHSRRSRAS